MLLLKQFCLPLMFAALTYSHVNAQQKDAPGYVDVQVDLNKPIAPIKPIWAWFGYDEPNFTYMKDGRKLLTELAALSPVPVYVRTHNLLTSGDGTAALKWGSTNIYTEDANGKPVYNYRLVDSIFDTYIKRGMKPLAQIGFMPEALSTRPQPYRNYWKPGIANPDFTTGWAYPPKDYQKWDDLIYQWVKHCVARYGQKEVESWYWEVWNEPNGVYWKGTENDFFKLYDYAVDGVKRALPTARIGGPDVTGGASKWLNDFIQHCLTGTNYVTGKTGTPMEVLLFHAKGAPKVLNGVVTMGISKQLNDIDTYFKLIRPYPQLRNMPIIIGESDPEGCAACSMATSPENAYRNGTMYSSYTAASFAREYELADEYGLNLIGAVSWSFEFENQPWFAGFRDLATNGVDKPVLNVFRMFGMMAGQRVKATSDRMYTLKAILDSGVRRRTDVGVLAAKDTRSATVMVWNYHDADLEGSVEDVLVKITGIASHQAKVTQYCIDNINSNSYTGWKKMGSPQNPDKGQINELLKAGRLQAIQTIALKPISNGVLNMPISVARQGVTLIKLDW